MDGWFDLRWSLRTPVIRFLRTDVSGLSGLALFRVTQELQSHVFFLFVGFSFLADYFLAAFKHFSAVGSETRHNRLNTWLVFTFKSVNVLRCHMGPAVR